MNVYGMNVVLVIALFMLPGIIYFIWFQKVGRIKAYRKLTREEAMGKIAKWQLLIKETEERRANGFEKIRMNGLMAFNNDQDKFNHWLNTSIPALNYRKPIELLDTDSGVDLVNNELLRIEYSVY